MTGSLYTFLRKAAENQEAIDEHDTELCWIGTSSYSEALQYLAQQLMQPPEHWRSWEIERLETCHPRCFNPWHATYVRTGYEEPTTRYEVEWPDILNRKEMFWAMASGEMRRESMHKTSKEVSLDEFYEQYATQEEIEQRPQKQNSSRIAKRRRSVRDTPETSRPETQHSSAP